jgi:predicted RND superfamily exporter protein
MSEIIIRYRNLIIGIAIALSLMSLLMLPRLEISPNLDEYVPEHLENVQHLKELNAIFGSTETILVMLHSEDVLQPSTMDRLSAIAKDLGKVEGIDAVISPIDSREIYVEDGFMMMDPILDEIP